MGIFLGDYQPVKEMYAGVPKEFITIENELNKIISIIKTDQEEAKLTKARTDIDNSASNKAIEDIFTKFFDLKGIKIHWTDQGINAYTRITSMPVMFITNKSNLQKTKRYINDNLSIYVFIDCSLVRMCDLNERELMAVLLHEIGHNLDTSPFYFLMTLPLLFKNPLVWAIQGFVSTVSSEIGIWFDNFVKTKIPFIYNLYVSIHDFMSQIQGPLLMGNLQQLIKYIIELPRYLPRAVFGYGMERFADSFAATYGYGKYQGSALHKMTNVDNLYKKLIVNTPVINVVSDFWNMVIHSVYVFVDPHPDTQTRIVNMLNKLKRDMDDPTIPKELQKELQTNIDAMEEFYKQFLNDPDTKKHKVFTYLSQQIADKIFGGKNDIREILNSLYETTEA